MALWPFQQVVLEPLPVHGYVKATTNYLTADAAVLEANPPQPGVRAHNAAPDNAVGQGIREALTDYLSANFPLRTPLI